MQKYKIKKIEFRGSCIMFWFYDWDKPIHTSSKGDGDWHTWFQKDELMKHIGKSGFSGEELSSRILNKGLEGIYIEVEMSKIKKISYE